MKLTTDIEDRRDRIDMFAMALITVRNANQICKGIDEWWVAVDIAVDIVDAIDKCVEEGTNHE